jgi:hypothetical protein
MSLSAATQNCWRQGGFFVVISALFCTFAFSYGGKGWGILTVLIFVFTFFNWLSEVKQKVMLSMGDELRTLPSVPTEFSWLDLDLLEQYSNKFTDLGFIKLTDYKLDEEYPPKGQGFARVFVHKDYHCFAEISQLLGAGKKPTTMEYYIGSSLERDWQLTTTTRPLLGVSFVWRNPKKLWTYNPHTSPEKLLQYHMQLRQKMIDNLQINVYPELSWDFYCDQINKSFIDRNKLWKRKNQIIGLIEVTLFEMNPPSQWLGDYKRFVKEKS